MENNKTTKCFITRLLSYIQQIILLWLSHLDIQFCEILSFSQLKQLGSCLIQNTHFA